MKCSLFHYSSTRKSHYSVSQNYIIPLFQGNVIDGYYSKGNVVIPLFPKNQGHYSTAKISIILIPLFLFSPRVYSYSLAHNFLKSPVYQKTFIESLSLFILGTGPSPTLLKSHLPPVVPHFTGRDKECADIIDHLTVRDTKFVNAWGSPGFGKTSVATAVGHELDLEGLPVLLLSLRGVKTVREMAK